MVKVYGYLTLFSCIAFRYFLFVVSGHEILPERDLLLKEIFSC